MNYLKEKKKVASFLKRLLKSVPFCFVLIFVSLNAKIIEIEHFAEIASYVKEEDWVLLDIDDTIYMPKTHVGRSDWFIFHARNLPHFSEDPQGAFLSFYPVWEKVITSVPIRCLEENIPSLIASLQKKARYVIAITNRDYVTHNVTLNQLQELAINFVYSSCLTHDLTISVKHRSLYTDGIIYACDMNAKGDVFASFVQMINLKPKKVILVDDKRSHLESMQKELSALGIEYIGLLYTQRKKWPYDAQIAEKEYLQFLE